MFSRVDIHPALRAHNRWFKGSRYIEQPGRYICVPRTPSSSYDGGPDLSFKALPHTVNHGSVSTTLYWIQEASDSLTKRDLLGLVVFCGAVYQLYQWGGLV